MKKIKKNTFKTKKQENAYKAFKDVAPNGSGTGMLHDYAISLIQKFKDCTPRDIMTSFLSDLDYFENDLRDTLRNLDDGDDGI